MNRVLPYGGHLDSASMHFRDNGKVVETPNPNKKFSRRAPSASNVSTVFDPTAPMPPCTPRGRARSRSPSMHDPFDGSRPDHWNNIPKLGVRVTRRDELQREAARHKEDHPHFFRKLAASGMHSSAESHARDVDPIVSARGLVSSGGKGRAETKNNESTAEFPTSKDYPQMARFRCSPARTGMIVTNAETLTQSGSPSKPQRFAASPSRRHESLVGVLVPAPRQAPPPAYKVRTPWHSDE